MGMPITTKTTGICFAFPNVCDTQTPAGPVPIPYPSIGQLSDAQQVTDGGSDGVYAAGNPLVTVNSSISSTTGDSAGTTGTTSGQPVGGPVEFPSGSVSDPRRFSRSYVKLVLFPRGSVTAVRFPNASYSAVTTPVAARIRAAAGTWYPGPIGTRACAVRPAEETQT